MAKDQIGSISQRAEQIDKVRDLTVLGVTKQIRSRSDLGDAAISERILVRKDGRPHDYTSIYRYLDALHFLGLDISEKYDYKQGAIEWSTDAIDLANLGNDYYKTQNISEPEKVKLRHQIFLSRAKEQFLASFTHPGVIFNDHRQFLEIASPLYVTELSSKRPKNDPDWPAEICVRITTDIKLPGSLKPKKEFLYTYRYWCLDTDIVDELNIQEAKRCGISPEKSYLIYPVEPWVEVKPPEFLDMLLHAVGYVPNQPQVYSIPWLLYKICPEYKLTVREFKRALISACQKYRDILHLERGPGGLIKGLEMAYYDQFDKRFGNHRYYPVVDGTIRTNLVIFPFSK